MKPKVGYSINKDGSFINEDHYSINKDAYFINGDRYFISKDAYFINEDRYFISKDGCFINEDRYSLNEVSIKKTVVVIPTTTVLKYEKRNVPVSKRGK